MRDDIKILKSLHGMIEQSSVPDYLIDDITFLMKETVELVDKIDYVLADIKCNIEVIEGHMAPKIKSAKDAEIEAELLSENPEYGTIRIELADLYTASNKLEDLDKDTFLAEDVLSLFKNYYQEAETCKLELERLIEIAHKN